MLLNLLFLCGLLQVILLIYVIVRQKNISPLLNIVETRYQLLQQQTTQAEQRVELRLQELNRLQLESAQQLKENLLIQSSALKEQLQQAFSDHRGRFDERQLETHKILHDTLQTGMQETRKAVSESLTEYANQFGKRVAELTQTTDARLKEINQQVEKRLTDGLAKTNETFSDIIKRLALIDAAQKQISELSTNVVSLQEILNDKRSRGAFGEVQLNALIRNVLPEQHFAFQHTLSNKNRVDCILFLPEPSGNIAIDSKFPLENFRVLSDHSANELIRNQASTQFKQDIKKHIQDIAEKYIIPGETADGAMMFIPAEAIFAEIHAHYPELVEAAHRARVWMVSPTTMMAVLTTARSVLKDAATRKQLHTIQEHLRLLSNDFNRFQERMNKLALHIEQAHEDVNLVNKSAQKISKRFGLIEKVELERLSTEDNLLESVDDMANVIE